MGYGDEFDDGGRRGGGGQRPSNALVALSSKTVGDADIVTLSAEEIVLLQGNLAMLTADQRVTYYGKVCQSVGLNPLTKPFDYIVLDGKLTLYAKKDATDQLRSIHGINVDKIDQAVINDIYTATVYGRDRTGRVDSDMGAVPIKGLQGTALANAMKKAITQGKRRMTLSLAGLGWLDESEVADTSAQAVLVTETGEILQPGETPKTLAAVVASQLATPTTERALEPAAAPEAGPDAPVAGEYREEAPERPADPTPPAEADADAGDGGTSPQPESPTTSETPPEATNTGADPAIVDEQPEKVGLSQEELKSFAREKFIPFAVINAMAGRLFPELRGKPIAELSDEQRLTLWMAVLADS